MTTDITKWDCLTEVLTHPMTPKEIADIINDCEIYPFKRLEDTDIQRLICVQKFKKKLKFRSGKISLIESPKIENDEGV